MVEQVTTYTATELLACVAARMLEERVEITTPPTEDERRLLREIDPAGMVIGK
jgi:hypothetical protein